MKTTNNNKTTIKEMQEKTKIYLHDLQRNYTIEKMIQEKKEILGTQWDIKFDYSEIDNSRDIIIDCISSTNSVFFSVLSKILDDLHLVFILLTPEKNSLAKLCIFVYEYNFEKMMR